MGRFANRKRGPGARPDDASDSASELSHDASSCHSNASSVASAFKATLERFRPGARRSPSNQGSEATAATTAPPSPDDGRSVDGAHAERLKKDAKSRFNIGLVYLETGNYAKAQGNLERSLYCHIQLNGRDARAYTNETRVAIARVREKLGECCLANAAVVDKRPAREQYEEARRLLAKIGPEDAPDDAKEMRARVERALESPALRGAEARRGSAAPIPGEREVPGNQTAEALLRMNVGDDALAAGEAGVATDAYEEAYGILKRDDPAGEMATRARRGCVKGHKLMAATAERRQDCALAVRHRHRACQIFDENDMCLPACRQLLRIAHLHGENGDCAEGAVAASDAIRRLLQGAHSVECVPDDRADLLAQCYDMRAVCYAKARMWREALADTDELLPLVARRNGRVGKRYNAALIRNAALLATRGYHRMAASRLDWYMHVAKLKHAKDGGTIVDDADHVLALDTAATAHVKLGHIDKAIEIFRRKVQYAETLPDNDEMKSDAMHKLGCLLANTKQHESALPLLNEALMTRRVLYDRKSRAVLETAWAVAATNQTLGDTDRALKEYSVLLDRTNIIDDLPVDSSNIHNCAGKLFFEDGKVDKAVMSFEQALLTAEKSGNSELKAEIQLNLANALSAQGESDKAMDIYSSLMTRKSLKKTKLFFLAAYNKSLLLVKIGDIGKAQEMLHKVADSRLPAVSEVRGSVYLALGNLSLSEGKVKEALEYYYRSLDVIEMDDVETIAQAKEHIGLAYVESGHLVKAISTFEDALQELSQPGLKDKSVNLRKAEIWICMSRAYKKKGNLSHAKQYAKLALQTYETALGETNPITLRTASNLQLLNLEEAEGLQKSEAKPIMDAAEYEMEEILETFVALNDPWTYRADVASLKTNLGLIAVWQGKLKKARKLLGQIQEIELPPDHSLAQRLEARVEEFEREEACKWVANKATFH